MLDPILDRISERPGWLRGLSTPHARLGLSDCVGMACPSREAVSETELLQASREDGDEPPSIFWPRIWLYCGVSIHLSRCQYDCRPENLEEPLSGAVHALNIRPACVAEKEQPGIQVRLG